MVTKLTLRFKQCLPRSIRVVPVKKLIALMRNHGTGRHWRRVLLPVHLPASLEVGAVAFRTEAAALVSRQQLRSFHADPEVFSTYWQIRSERFWIRLYKALSLPWLAVHGHGRLVLDRGCLSIGNATRGVTPLFPAREATNQGHRLFRLRRLLQPNSAVRWSHTKNRTSSPM